ncbi:MAG: DUF1496 domain-containing protein [Pseudomonadales bacterium]|nr:DUF1496 domain-containing protein [Pseudomonadales bacterium]
MRLFPALFICCYASISLAQTLETLPRYQHFNTNPHDEKKHCMFENKLYSEGAVLSQAGLLMQCTDKDERVKIVRLGWQILVQPNPGLKINPDS